MNNIDRCAVVSDADAIASLRMLMQFEINGKVEAAQTERAHATMVSYFEKNISDGSFVGMIAIRDGKYVATNGVSFYHTPPGLDGEQSLVGYITNVYTLPEYRGKGIASGLFKQLIETAREFNPYKLHLGATEIGKEMYERHGFKSPRWPQLEMRL